MNAYGEKTEICCWREPWSGSVKFLLKHRSWTPESSIFSHASPITLVQLTPKNEGMELPPTFSLNDEATQALMDEIWRAGFRPREGSGSAGSLAATERHLADMRHLVFKTKPEK